MSGIQDFAEYKDDFYGAGTLPTSATAGTDWVITETSSSGTPTFAVVSPSATGEVALTFDNTSEIQNVCLSHGNVLGFDIDNIQQVEYRVKFVATADTATTLVVGVGSARNDNPDSVAANAYFKCAGSNAIVVETDDGVNDNDDKATGKSLVASYKRLVIDFTGGKSNVKFYVDGDRVAASTTFDMSNYSGSLQPLVQLQKTADTNTDSVTVDYVRILSKR